MDEKKVVRCAVYTRKSTDEGLEQEFNSLDAQREAGSAYILSQRHEGWIEVLDRYDDGGYSGGNMERPGLKRLLADIAAGKVDTIVVYKVDRLTRALTDFARIVEVLDTKGASFVSVTQSLNSTTSMGRLTLNVLLSFAQFEREVTGERIRDKIAASKRKGMFMGGPVPIGYDVKDRKLIINEAEARSVRHIFTRYAELGSGREVIEELRAAGYRTKQRQVGGRVVGGIPFERGVLFHLLANPIYIGKVVHKDVEHAGEHEPIINEELWTRVQQHIADNRVNRRRARNSQSTSLLAGILRDGHGRRMTPSHAVKNGRRYRYYVTHASELRPGAPQAWRMPAQDVEAAVIDRLVAYFRDYREIANLAGVGNAAATIASLVQRASDAAQRLGDPARRGAVFAKLITSIAMTREEITIEIDRIAVARILEASRPDDPNPILLSASATKVREGKATKLVLAEAGHSAPQRDAKLVALLAEARSARDLILDSPDRSIRVIAADQQRCRHRIAKLVRLSWLSPEIATAIVEGRQPKLLTVKKLLDIDWPLDWNAQASLLSQYV
ncbi:recombinase family protein [Sphingomonas sp. GC_Shp_3]|uniref:recombinase family protein n=1 Tax=Sphingomonas sp. GC_Shp_3 TaxID=2937383 RepID=UPI002269EAD1|nr:recombinase family protein [Sphingomonas sp. GC_Shp_3]